MGVSRTTQKGTVRSVQYVSTALDKDTTTDSITPSPSFVDFTKVILVPVAFTLVGSNGGEFANVRGEVVSNSNVTVHHTAPGGTITTTATWAAFAIEFY